MLHKPTENRLRTPDDFLQFVSAKQCTIHNHNDLALGTTLGD